MPDTWEFLVGERLFLTGRGIDSARFDRAVFPLGDVCRDRGGHSRAWHA